MFTYVNQDRGMISSFICGVLEKEKKGRGEFRKALSIL